MTAHDKEVLERLGFKCYDNKPKLYYRTTKQFHVEIENGVVMVRRWRNCGPTITDERKYPPWVKKDLAELRAEGVVK